MMFFLYFLKVNNYYILKKGSTFGQYSFITGMQREETAESSGFSQISYLKREDFLEILKDFPLDYVKN